MLDQIQAIVGSRCRSLDPSRTQSRNQVRKPHIYHRRCNLHPWGSTLCRILHLRTCTCTCRCCLTFCNQHSHRSTHHRCRRAFRPYPRRTRKGSYHRYHHRTCIPRSNRKLGRYSVRSRYLQGCIHRCTRVPRSSSRRCSRLISPSTLPLTFARICHSPVRGFPTRGACIS